MRKPVITNDRLERGRRPDGAALPQVFAQAPLAPSPAAKPTALIFYKRYREINSWNYGATSLSQEEWDVVLPSHRNDRPIIIPNINIECIVRQSTIVTAA